MKTMEMFGKRALLLTLLFIAGDGYPNVGACGNG